MEPAEPVIIIHLSFNKLPIASISTTISSRGSRSSMFISLNCTCSKSFSPVHSFVCSVRYILTLALMSMSCNVVLARNLSTCMGETSTALMSFDSITSSSLSFIVYIFSPINVFPEYKSS